MKKRIARRLLPMLCFVLLFAVCLGFSACRKDEGDGGDSGKDSVTAEPGGNDEETTADNVGKQITLSTGGKAYYTIVRPADASSALATAVSSLATTLSDATGVYFRQTDDYTRDETPVESSMEIIIGNCKRADTAKVLKNVKYKDYNICVTEKNIVVAAHDDVTAIRATQKLAQMLKGNIARSGVDTVLTWKGDYYYSAVSYKLSEISLGGVSLRNYVIVYPADDPLGKSFSESMKDAVGSLCGDVLEIVPDTAPARPYEILLGNTSRSGGVLSQASLEPMEYLLTTDGSKVIVSGAYSFSTSKAVEAFKTWVLQTGKGVIDGMNEKKSLLAGDSFAANTGDIRVMEYNILVEYPGWGSGGNIPPEVEIRKEIVSSVINGYKPDVLCMCEFFENWRNQLPPLLDPAYRFVAIDRTDGYSNRTTLVYNSDTLTLIKGGYDDSVALIDNNINKRVVMWAVFEVKESGERFMVLGSHFDSEANAESNRTKQAQIMVSLMKRLQAEYGGSTAILIGDFNAAKGTNSYKAFLDGTGYVDAVDFDGNAEKMVDHMFYDQTLLEKVGTIIERGKHTATGSDHSPVIADFRFRK